MTPQEVWKDAVTAAIRCCDDSRSSIVAERSIAIANKVTDAYCSRFPKKEPQEEPL